MKNSETVGRFAPSPTGPLHFGSLIAAVGSYCIARHQGGRWLVRIEDLDSPRVVPGAADAILRMLESLGFNWDGEVLWQSRRQEAYHAAICQLQQRGLIYPCACSRREILASAPHPGEEGPVYPGLCRQGLPAGRSPRTLRLLVPDRNVAFTDKVFGRYEQNLSSDVGDFVLRRADGLFAYQLAVVVDDADSGVNQVVRGADLLGSTPRQIYLQECLGFPVPNYFHLPIAVSVDGVKISKRDCFNDFRLSNGRGEILWRAMRWLGQNIPEELRHACPSDVLDWGAKSFNPEAIPAAQEIAVDSVLKSG